MTDGINLKKAAPMHWLEDHNLMLIRECLLIEPWKYRQGSNERGNIWKRISEILNALEHPQFRVTDRSCRDHLTVLMKKFKKEESKKEKASGIDVEEETELERGLRDIIELFEDQERLVQEKNQTKQQKKEEAMKAQEFRLASLETLGQTKKRRLGTSEEVSSPAKSRRSSNDTISYLKEKSALDYEVRRQELEIRKQELEASKKESDNLQEFLLNQQTQTAQLLQQQQEMDLAIMKVLGQFVPQNKQ